MPYPTELVLCRAGAGEPYRIGVRAGAEHALGWLRGNWEVQRNEPGEWVFIDPQRGEEAADTRVLEPRDWIHLIPQYPRQTLELLLPTSVHNGICSSVTFRLVLRGVRNPTAWLLESDTTSVRLRDADGNIRSSIEMHDWWWVSSQKWTRLLARELVDRTNLRELTAAELLESIRSGSGA